MAKTRHVTKKHPKKSSKHTRRHRSIKRGTRRSTSYRSRGGRGYTTGAAAELSQMAPATFKGAGLAFMNGGSSRK